jgi:large subunit ribosomal protein L25
MATLQAESRERASSSEVRRLRRKGIMPMAVVGHGKGTRLIQAPSKDVKDVISQTQGLVMFDLSVDEEPKPVGVIVKQVQRDEVTRKVIHITLQEIKPEDSIKINIPIVVTAQPDIVLKRDATFTQMFDSLEVVGIVKNLPNQIEIDASGMEMNDTIVISDLELPEGIVPQASEDSPVISTQEAKKLVLVTEEPEGEEGEEGDGEEGEEESEEAEEA